MTSLSAPAQGEWCTHCTSLQVRFQGRDSSGRPILVVRLTKACQECHGEQADQVAEAVLSQVRGAA